MSNEFPQFEQRKQDHIKLALMPENQASEYNCFDALHLIHEALPDLDFEDICLETFILGQKTTTPFLVSSMTAGHEKAATINRNLLSACAQSNWALGVGSQRRELFDVNAAKEWIPLRKEFPQVRVFGNLGIAQVIHISKTDIERLIHNLQAQALIIHCNPLQEVIQPEGTPQFKGCWQALEQLTKQLTVPLIIKETGCGFSSSTLKRLNEIGVAAVEISGLGGTHWGRIEGLRAKPSSIQQKTAETFKNWGITTLQSVSNAIELKPRFEIWGSGGVRNGLDAAKLLALGTNIVGLAKPMLAPALQSAEEVYALMMQIHYELKVAMFCTGSRFIHELQEKACL